MWNIDELELEGDTSPREMTEAYEYKIENKTYLESLTSTAFDQYLDNGSPRSDFVLEREMSSSPEGSDEDPKVDGPVEDEEVPEVKPGTSLGRRNSFSTVGLRNLDILEEFRLPLGNSERYGVGGLCTGSTSSPSAQRRLAPRGCARRRRSWRRRGA